MRTGLNRTWFCINDQPHVEDDDLGIYAYASQANLNVLQLFDAQAACIVNKIACSSQAWTNWFTNGTLIINMFSWLWDGIDVDGVHKEGIGKQINEEFAMYSHYQCRFNG